MLVIGYLTLMLSLGLYFVVLYRQPLMLGISMKRRNILLLLSKVSIFLFFCTVIIVISHISSLFSRTVGNAFGRVVCIFSSNVTSLMWVICLSDGTVKEYSFSENGRCFKNATHMIE